MPASASASSIGTDLRRPKIDIAISQTARQQGLYIIGTTGTGKSTLLANLILQDIEQGLGVCLIEPHGDLTNSVLSGIPEHRLMDVILLDLMDSEYPFGLNLFECGNVTDMNEVARTASFVFHVFQKVWGVGESTPRLSQVLRNVTYTLIENPDTTFAEIPLLLWDEQAREKLIANVKNQQSQLFWVRYSKMSAREKREYVESTDNKADAYLASEVLRHIVAQTRTTVDLRHIMDNRKLLLVKLSPQFEEASRLIGAILIGKLLMAAYSREDIEEDKRRQFNLYCDEYQRFATADFASHIQEVGRKFRVPVTLAHQTLSQLDSANRGAASGAANMIVFRISGEDGKELAKNFDTTPTPMVVGEEPVRAPVADVISYLIKRGHNDSRVTRFAQSYLQRLETFTADPPRVGRMPANVAADADWAGVILFEYDQICISREQLNQCLYTCMVTGDCNSLIPLLALYMLAVAQHNGSDGIFMPYLKTEWLESKLNGFDKRADGFGDPRFLSEGFTTKLIESAPKKKKAVAAAFVEMLTELRYTMEVIARKPIMVDTGQYKPKRQDRTYADMENQIANNLSRQPNYQAKVKLLYGEYDVRTSPAPGGLTGWACSY